MQFGKEIRDVLVALETATADAIRAVDQMNLDEGDLDALLAGTAVARVGELNHLLFQKIEAAALAMLEDLVKDLDLADAERLAEATRGWMN